MDSQTDVNILLFRVALIFFSVLFLTAIFSCNQDELLHKASISTIILQNKTDKLSELVEKYEGEILKESSPLLTQEFQKKILLNTVLADTLIKFVKRVDNKFFILAEISSNPKNRIFAELETTKEIYDSFSPFGSENALMALSINSINIEQTILYAENTSNEKFHGKAVNDILIKGQCLELVQLPEIIL